MKVAIGMLIGALLLAGGYAAGWKSHAATACSLSPEDQAALDSLNAQLPHR